MSKWIVDIHGDIEGDYEIIGEYQEPKTDGDCISRQAVLDELDKHKYSNGFCEEHNIDWSINLGMAHIAIKELPSATLQEQKTGHWMHKNDDFNDWFECSECEYGAEGEITIESGVRFRYCPNCGAKMESEE